MAVKSFREAKEVMKGLLEKYYATTSLPSIATLTERKVEERGFLRAQDAKIISKIVKERYYVSFRAAGVNTLERITAGHPCKGHNITTKSVKKTDKPNLNDWSYALSEENKNIFKGLVGNPGDTGTPPVLAGIWTLQRPSMLDKDPKKRKTTDVPLTLDEVQTKIRYCYTGDYDMHDLIGVKSGRVIAETIDERAIIDEMNRNLLKNDLPRWHESLNDLTCKGVISNNLMPAPTPEDVLPQPMLKEVSGNYLKSSYALIRHGAQTNYVDFMLSQPTKKELKKLFEEAKAKNLAIREKPELLNGHPEVNLFPELKEHFFLALTDNPVVTIEPHFVMFAPDGKIYDLDGLTEIYAFFKKNEILDRIPFYYFFRVLKKSINDNVARDKNAKEELRRVRECEECINKILEFYK